MLFEIGVILACLIGACTLYFWTLFAKQCWTLKKFKGPFALPMLGNCYHGEALYFLRYMVRLRKKFGKIFTFFGFTKPYLVVCDPIVVRRILSDSKTFYKGTDYTHQFSVAFGQGLVTSNGDKHKKDRAVFGKYFIRSNINKLTKLINDISVQAIDDMLVSADGKPKVHNIEHFFATVALRVFMKFSIGTDYRTNPAREKELCHAVSTGSWAVGRVISLGVPMWSFIPWVKLIKTARASVLSDFHSIVAERRAQMAAGTCELDDCLTAMIAEDMNETDMADHFVTLICAGHDTTAYFSSYMCMLLAQNPEVQEKLYEEIKTTPDEITPDDVIELKYLQKVMQETLRLYSIIPQVTRVSAEEVHIKEANVTIPAGVNCLIPMFLINRDPEIWDNPAQFIPERFDGRSNVDFTSAKNGFFPFGYGSRTCIGNTLAQIESTIFMCKLLKKFRFEEDVGFKPSILSGISLTTSNGINISISPR